MVSAKELLSQLTLNEKISLLSGCGTFCTKEISAKGVPAVKMCDGPHGLCKKVDITGNNLAQESVRSICFPSLSSMANSWDEDLLREVGSYIGCEAQVEDIHIVLGPGVNIKRNPLCGRNFEYFSEDPLLSGKLGAAWVRGVQDQGVGVSVKHFCCNNQESERMTISSEVDERTLREIYLKPFEIAVKESNPATIMCSYNRVNGTFLSDNQRILREVLFEQWGYSGFVITDWGAMNDRVASVKARLSLEMPDSLGFFNESIRTALESGELTEREIDDCLEPMLNKILFLKRSEKRSMTYSIEEHHQFTRNAAAKCAVLMRNGGMLPLQQGEKICVIGEFANQPRFQGTGSSKVNPYRVDTILGSLNAYGVQYEYSPGFNVSRQNQPELLEQALELTSRYDDVLLVLGLPESYESEGFDRSSMELPAEQNELVRRIAAQGKRICVVFLAGGCVEMPWAQDVNAILYMGLGGEATGSACVDVLYGNVNPSGKLAETWPFEYKDHITSTFWLESPTQAIYKEGIFVGYRYFDTANIAVRFPFGHGLSYTLFAYESLEITQKENGFLVTFVIKNIGPMDGAEIVQLYTHPVSSIVNKPEQELRWFQKVILKVNEEVRVSVLLNKEIFEHYDIMNQAWCIENGEYEIRISASSVDIRLRKVVMVKFGQDNDEVEHSWYSSLKGIPTTADFEKESGRRIMPIPAYRRGTYDMNSSLVELSKHCLLARVILWAGRFAIAKTLGRKPDDSDPEFRMMMTVAQTAPLRNLALTAPHSMSGALARFIIRWANGFRG